MGISGLLPCLKSIEEVTHISAFRGQRVGVDTYCWLHKLCRGSAEALATGAPTTAYLQNLVTRVETFRRNGLDLVMVFDGADLPLKGGTNAQRRAKRRGARERAGVLSAQGRAQEARTEYAASLDITPAIAQSLIRVLRAKGVECLVAPYEADAQLAYLAQTGYVQAVVTEDSDLLAYLTPVVVFKVDHAGTGIVVRSERLPEVRDLKLTAFTRDMVLTNCIMAGCDYLPSLRGVGVKKANKLVSEYKSIDRILEVVRTDPRYSAAASGLGGYEHEFLKAFLTFRHHIVYDPVARKARHFHDIAEGVLDPQWLSGVLGDLWDDAVARGVCEDCTLNPETLTAYDEENNAPLRNAAQYLSTLQASRKAHEAYQRRLGGTGAPRSPEFKARRRTVKTNGGTAASRSPEGKRKRRRSSSSTSPPPANRTSPEAVAAVRRIQFAGGCFLAPTRSPPNTVPVGGKTKLPFRAPRSREDATQSQKDARPAPMQTQDAPRVLTSPQKKRRKERRVAEARYYCEGAAADDLPPPQNFDELLSCPPAAGAAAAAAPPPPPAPPAPARSPQKLTRFFRPPPPPPAAVRSTPPLPLSAPDPVVPGKRPPQPPSPLSRGVQVQVQPAGSQGSDLPASCGGSVAVCSQGTEDGVDLKAEQAFLAQVPRRLCPHNACSTLHSAFDVRCLVLAQQANETAERQRQRQRARLGPPSMPHLAELAGRRGDAVPPTAASLGRVPVTTPAMRDAMLAVHTGAAPCRPPSSNATLPLDGTGPAEALQSLGVLRPR